METISKSKVKKGDKFVALVYEAEKDRIKRILPNELEDEQLVNIKENKLEILRVKEAKVKIKQRIFKGKMRRQTNCKYY